MFKKGFTLIELLVVVSIISLLSSIISVIFTEARRKGDDGYKQLQVKEVEKAVALYRNEYGYVPDDNVVDPDSFAQEGTAQYNQIMQELVDKGFIAAIPKSKKGNEFSYWASPDLSESIFRAKLSNQTFYPVPDPIIEPTCPDPENPDCGPPPSS